jgi:hypothetical protein
MALVVSFYPDFLHEVPFARFILATVLTSATIDPLDLHGGLHPYRAQEFRS